MSDSLPLRAMCVTSETVLVRAALVVCVVEEASLLYLYACVPAVPFLLK